MSSVSVRNVGKSKDVATIDTVDLNDQDAPGALDRALRKDGFVELVGHGLQSDVADELWTGMEEFFALPFETKAKYVVDDAAANRGYRQRGSEALSYSLGEASPPDLFESFNSGHDKRAGGHRLIQATPWPADAPAFAVAARRYLDEMADLAGRLDHMIGEILGIDNLAGRSTTGPDTMACIRYERLDDEATPAPGQKRMGAHSDYTTFTILRADPVPGLEILGSDGWKPIVPAADALLLNVGDLLAMWTNDAWPSTVHRVPLHGNGTDPVLRRSVAYFHYPDLDVAVEPLPAFQRPDSTYRAVTVADHLGARLIGPKRHTPSTGTSTLSDRTI
ncbi:MAG: isopenicillin N synthase-like dioxygenase [Ilumatobacter sp.]|jgi:isopenicillin N synthase-like dioxygenase